MNHQPADYWWRIQVLPLLKLLNIRQVGCANQLSHTRIYWLVFIIGISQVTTTLPNYYLCTDGQLLHPIFLFLFKVKRGNIKIKLTWYSHLDLNQDRALIWRLMPGINRLHSRCAMGAFILAVVKTITNARISNLETDLL